MSLTPEQREARRIGGSTIAKILKKSRWGTPLDAYLDLRKERPVAEKSGEDIDRGNFLEPALREWANKKIGQEFVQHSMIVSKEWDWATVNPDGIGVETRDLLEIKAPRRDDLLQWGEDGSDEVPNDALLQTHWGMMVSNANRGFVAALLGGDLRIFRIERDRELEAKMLAAAKSFVDSYVIPGIPPPPEFGDDANILYLHPKNTQPYRKWASLSEQEKYVVGTYLGAYQFESDALKALEGWEPVVKSLVGDAAGIEAPLDPAEWQKLGCGLKRLDWTSRAPAVKWKSVAESLMSKMSKEEQEALVAAHTPKDGSRSLRPYFITEKKGK